MIKSQPGGSEMSRKVSGSSFRGIKVVVGIARRGENTGTFGRSFLGVVGGSVLVIVGKGAQAKKSKLKGGSRVQVKGGRKI